MPDDQGRNEQVQPEPDYEPPQVEELESEERTATAAWIATGP